MNQQHQALIKKFYSGFADRDAEVMASCYHEEAVFSDPGFGTLQGSEVGDMWRMLLERGGKDLLVIYSGLKADDHRGLAYWEAVYTFSKTGRKVHNKVRSLFNFKEGLIIRHIDEFDFWEWSKMALGAPGTLLGWSGLLKNKVQTQARSMLKHYREKRTLSF